MRYKEKRKNSKQFNAKFKRRFFTKKAGIIWICVLVIGLGMTIAYMRIEKRVNSYEKTIDELSTEIDDLKKTNQDLEEEIDNVSSDEYIEKLARERLGMVKKGEYTLKQSKDSTEEDEKDTESSKK